LLQEAADRGVDGAVPANLLVRAAAFEPRIAEVWTMPPDSDKDRRGRVSKLHSITRLRENNPRLAPSPAAPAFGFAALRRTRVAQRAL
jgi:hypothetical protein